MKVFKGCFVGAIWFAIPFLALTAFGCSAYGVHYQQGDGVGIYEWNK